MFASSNALSATKPIDELASRIVHRAICGAKVVFEHGTVYEGNHITGSTTRDDLDDKGLCAFVFVLIPMYFRGFLVPK